jgi:FkbM family methyltransferase
MNLVFGKIIKKNKMNKLIKCFFKTLSESTVIVKASNLIVALNTNDCNSDIKSNGELVLLKSLLNNCNVVVDVGCNIGEYSKEILLNNYKGNLIVIDALQINIDKTRELLTTLNPKNKITFLPFALGDKEDVLSFYINDDENLSGHNSFFDMKEIGYTELTHTVKIETKRLDNLLLDLNVKIVDFMKIDVEGFEMKVLKGLDNYLKRGAVKILQLEYGHAARVGRILLKDIYEYLKDFGYSAYIVMPKGLLKLEYTPFIENKYSMINICFIHISATDFKLNFLSK